MNYNFSIKKGMFGRSLFEGENFVCIVIDEQLPVFEALVNGYNESLKPNPSKIALRCEDKLKQIANTFGDIGKCFNSMKIIDKLQKELIHIDDIATLGIKEELKKKQPNTVGILSMLKEMINDGYKGLSINLSSEILAF